MAMGLLIVGFFRSLTADWRVGTLTAHGTGPLKDHDDKAIDTTGNWINP